MLKMQMIGNLGRDAIVNVNGTQSVINFTIAHTEKYKDSAGILKEKTTWVNCAYWKDNTAVAQYLKKGTLVYIEGFPFTRPFTDRSGENKASFECRVISVQLLGGQKEIQQSQAPGPQQQQQMTGYQPHSTTETVGEDDDLPF